MSNVMTYYWTDTGLNDRVVARSYKISDGWIFSEGTRFEEIDSITGLHHFFEVTHSFIETKKLLTRYIKSLQKKYGAIKIEKLEYR